MKTVTECCMCKAPLAADAHLVCSKLCQRAFAAADTAHESQQESARDREALQEYFEDLCFGSEDS